MQGNNRALREILEHLLFGREGFTLLISGSLSGRIAA